MPAFFVYERPQGGTWAINLDCIEVVDFTADGVANVWLTGPGLSPDEKTPLDLDPDAAAALRDVLMGHRVTRQRT
jgi:hypothetical protein